MRAKACVDIDKLVDLEPGSPENKNVVLHLSDGTEINIDILTHFADRYVGMGTISGYVPTPRQIYIEKDNYDSWWIYFNRRTFSPLQVAMGTFINPIPDPRWKTYEKKRLERNFRLEAEYKTLRLPFLLGMPDNTYTPLLR